MTLVGGAAGRWRTEAQSSCYGFAPQSQPSLISSNLNDLSFSQLGGRRSPLPDRPYLAGACKGGASRRRWTFECAANREARQPHSPDTKRDGWVGDKNASARSPSGFEHNVSNSALRRVAGYTAVLISIVLRVPMRLPEDIIELVVDQALTVGALDTSPGCTHPTARIVTASALESLKDTKLALLLVSHMVYRLCARRVDEVVSVYDPSRLPSLLAYLHLHGSFMEHSHGFYCRRLDIDILVDESSTWLHGATTLWGLILACPRLEILNVNVISLFSRKGYLCPVSLLIQIADAYGQRLRRLEMCGLIGLHFSGMRYLSSRCPRLEVLCVPGMFAVQDAYESDNLSDDLDSLVDRIILSKESVSQALPSMSANERNSFAHAHGRARQWRTLLSSSTVRFPSLHTLEIGDYIDFTRRWDIPLLTTLHSSFGADTQAWERIDHRAVQSAAIARIGPQLHSWTVSTARYFDPLAQLERVPNLRYLGFVVPDPTWLDPNHRGQLAHKNLKDIDLVFDSPFQPPWAWVAYFRGLVQARGLPALECIRIVAPFLYDRWAQEFDNHRVALAGLGIRLEYAPGVLTHMHTVFHVPALMKSTFEIPKDVQLMNNMLSLYSHHYPDLVRRLTGVAQPRHIIG